MFFPNIVSKFAWLNRKWGNSRNFSQEVSNFAQFFTDNEHFCTTFRNWGNSHLLGSESMQFCQIFTENKQIITIFHRKYSIFPRHCWTVFPASGNSSYTQICCFSVFWLPKSISIWKLRQYVDVTVKYMKVHVIERPWYCTVELAMVCLTSLPLLPFGNPEQCVTLVSLFLICYSYSSVHKWTVSYNCFGSSIEHTNM